MSYNKENQKNKVDILNPLKKMRGDELSLIHQIPTKATNANFSINLKTELSIFQKKPHSASLSPSDITLNSARGYALASKASHCFPVITNNNKKTPQLFIYRSNEACKKCWGIKFIVRIEYTSSSLAKNNTSPNKKDKKRKNQRKKKSQTTTTTLLVTYGASCCV